MSNFLKKITGIDNFISDEEILDEDLDIELEDIRSEESSFELGVDIFEDEKNIYLQAFIPAIKRENIDINLTRDMLEISGERKRSESHNNGKYFQRELNWGKFSKKILLPHEVEVDRVKAQIEDGMITLKMPKLDKDRLVKVSLD